MTALQPPSLRIVTKYTRVSGGADRELPLVLFGGLASVIRYADGLNKADGALGVYNGSPAAIEGIPQTLYPWPMLPVGNVVDLNSVKLHVEDGLWRYHEDTDNDAIVNADRASFTAENGVIFGTNSSGTSTVVDGGVKVGDYVRITAANQISGRSELVTSVVGLRGEIVNSSYTGATLSSTAHPTQSASSSVVSSPASAVNISLNHTNYNGLNGNPNESYTIEVIVGGAAGTAVLSVTSASGNDNVASLQTVALGNPLTLTSRGLVATFSANVAITTFTVGQKWVVSVSDVVAARTITTSGTYTGLTNRTYIVEVVTGGWLVDGAVQIRVRSQDGTDQLSPVTLTEAATGVSGSFAIGSYGITGVLNAASGVVKGDSWSIVATAKHTGALTVVELSDTLPSTVIVDSTTVAMTYEFYRVVTREIPDAVGSDRNWQAEATQISVRSNIDLEIDGVTLGGTAIVCRLYGTTDIPSLSKLFVSYRAWYPIMTAPVQVLSSANLDVALNGPLDPDNILKFGVNCARYTAGSNSVFVMAVGDPTDIDNWTAAASAADRMPNLYQYVALTDDEAAHGVIAGAIAGSNSETSDTNRVGWLAAPKVSGEKIVSDAVSTDNELVLAVIEDDSTASGTQYTQVRITSGNANIQTAGVRIGDRIRYDFDVDAEGHETYELRNIVSIRSGTTFTIDSALPENGIPKRIEICRVFTPADLVEYYSRKASAWGSEHMRYVVCPEISVSGKVVPGYFGAAMVSGMRTSILPHQPLSTIAVNGIEAVYGLETLTNNDLNLLAGAGCMLVVFDHIYQSVIVRHGVTTGETEVLAKREESMVTARHLATRIIRSRLRPLVAQININSLEDDDRVEELVRSSMDSIRGQLMTLYYTPELGGLIADLIIDEVVVSHLQLDEVIIRGRLFLGRPGNVITFEETIS